MASDIQQTPFVKQLAANGKSWTSSLQTPRNVLKAIDKTPLLDRPTRDAALQSLRTYLSGARPLAPLDLLKIWKGLFYCMWMCDRPRPQQALASDLASLITILPPSTVIPFLRAFWQTMAREWTNIDVLRMEKFLLLTRRVIGATFAYLESKRWEGALVDEHLHLFEELPLNAMDAKLPNGMRYHVIDVYVDELERVGVLETELESVPLDTLLKPLRQLWKDSPTKAVRQKCKEVLADERLPGNEKPAEVKEVADDEWGGIED